MKSIKGGQHPGKKNEADKMLKQMANMLKGSLGKPQPNTTGISYSDLLLQLIKPYQQSKGNMRVEELEYLLDMGVTAWNLAVYKKKDDFLYKAYLTAVKSSVAMDKASDKLLKKLTEDKEKLFGQYNDTLLEDFEIVREAKGKVIVNVISKPFDIFLKESVSGSFKDNPFESAVEADEIEEDDDDDDDDMPDYVLPVVNRNVVMIKPKQPFMDWLRKIHFPEEPPLPGEQSVYLLPEYETDKDAERYLKENFDRIFCNEIWGLDIDEKDWPANRTWKMFTDWFDVKIEFFVYDMANYPLEKK